MGDAIIPSDWTGEYCCYSILWPNSVQWLAVLRGVIILPSRGRFWAESTGNIVEAQSVIKTTFDHNLANKECLMSCGDESLSEIAAAIRLLAANQCCSGGPVGSGGSGGSGPIEPEPSDVEQGNINSDDPPPGFDSWDEYFSYKCAVAKEILELFENSLETIVIINFGAMGIESLSIALTVIIALAVPPAAIVGIATLLLSVGGQVVIATLLSYINDNRDALICELYNGTNSETSQDNFHNALGELVDAGTAELVTAFAIKQVAKYFINNAVTNRLYDRDLSKDYPASDCSDCGEGGMWITRTDENYDSIDTFHVASDWWQIASVVGSGNLHGLFLQVNTADVGVKVEFQNLVGHSVPVQDSTPLEVGTDVMGVYTYNGTSFAAMQSAASATYLHLPNTDQGRQWAIMSQTAFTVEIKTSIEGGE
jgi:hypothetical protein